MRRLDKHEGWNLKFSWSLKLAVWSLLLPACISVAQETASLPGARFLDGEQTLRSFAPISKATRESIVKFNVDGETVALGTIVDTNGLAITKASEIKAGKLTCWLANEQEVAATVLRTDEEEDVALVKIEARNLK